MEFEDNTFDGIFSVEATCHSKDLVDVFKEVARVLKPGGLFVDSSWCVTDTYDPQNPLHVKVKDGIIVSLKFFTFKNIHALVLIYMCM